jgi:DNA-binding NarL/FixJ family response regulator
MIEALSCGVRGYLEEEALITFLPKAVRCVDAGEAWVPRSMVARIIERLAHVTAKEKG